MQNFSGPQMSGEFVSIRTGETVIVRDCVQLDGEKYHVRLSTGETIPINDFTSNYYQMADDNIYDNNGNIIGKDDGKNKPQVQLEDPINYDLMFAGMEEPEIPIPVVKKSVVESSSNDMISKIFEKKSTIKPTITVSIDFNEFPKTEINVIKDCFDITDKDITDTIISYFNLEAEIKNKMSDALSDILK